LLRFGAEHGQLQLTSTSRASAHPRGAFFHIGKFEELSDMKKGGCINHPPDIYHSYNKKLDILSSSSPGFVYGQDGANELSYIK
jgi:hypothetical protein